LNNQDNKKQKYGKLSQTHFKLIRSLELKKQRQKRGLFVIEGEKLISDILKTNIKIRTFFALEECLDSMSLSNKSNSNLILVNNIELRKLSFLSSPNKILAIAEKASLPKNEYDPKKPSLVLDTIQDPGNLGTILRIACWYGIEQVVCSDKTADHLNPKVIQSSMGAFAHLNVFYTSLESFFKKHQNIKVYGASLDGKNINNIQFVTNPAIVIGNESKGISEEVSMYLDEKISIPKYGPMESLNAAIATAVICDHFKMDQTPH
jgi:TrmH family RNA methyltransferase